MHFSCHRETRLCLSSKTFLPSLFLTLFLSQMMNSLKRQVKSPQITGKEGSKNRVRHQDKVPYNWPYSISWTVFKELYQSKEGRKLQRQGYRGRSRYKVVGVSTWKSRWDGLHKCLDFFFFVREIKATSNHGNRESIALMRRTKRWMKREEGGEVKESPSFSCWQHCMIHSLPSLFNSPAVFSPTKPVECRSIFRHPLDEWLTCEERREAGKKSPLNSRRL